MRRAIWLLGLMLAAPTATAAPASIAFDDDLSLLQHYEPLGQSHLLPISEGLSNSYSIAFFHDAAGGGIFNRDGALTINGSALQGSAIGFRLIVATIGEAEHVVDAIPFADTLTGPVDPQEIALLIPAVQSAREAAGGGGGGGGGGGPTCEPPPEPVCEPPPDSGAPFEPVDWLVFDFGAPLLNVSFEASYLFSPAGSDFGPNDMAIEVYYLRQVEVDEPPGLAIFGLAVLAVWAGYSRRRRRS